MKHLVTLRVPIPPPEIAEEKHPERLHALADLADETLVLIAEQWRSMLFKRAGRPDPGEKLAPCDTVASILESLDPTRHLRHRG